jgi:hypothetical protein
VCVHNEARKLSFASNVSHFQRPLWSSIGNRGSRPKAGLSLRRMGECVELRFTRAN